MTVRKLAGAVLVGAMLCVAAPALAVPGLQLYIDGATYDAANETWVINANEFDLWVLGDVGSWGTITDVKLAASGYGKTDGASINITPKTTSVLADPSTPQSPSLVLDPSTLDPPTSVTQHEEYQMAEDHTFWHLGDFTLTDSPIGDYQYGTPTSFPTQGQINVYRVSFSGYEALHFDAFDHVVVNNNKVKVLFAPYSHDAGTGVPEPGTLALLGSGLAAAALRFRRRRSR